MDRLIKLLVLILIIIIISLILPEEKLSEKIKIGVSDDASGFIVDYMLKDEKINRELEAYFIKDCWAKTAQWALSSEVFQMAIVCKEAAIVFIENVDGFEIVSDCIRNSDIFVLKSSNPKKIGVTQDRNYQLDLVKARFGNDIEIIPMMAQALPYALENGEVDGIILDIMKGIYLEGKKENIVNSEEYTSYVLIVNTEYKNTKEFGKFVKEYNSALEKLMKNVDLFEEHFFDYNNIDTMERGLDKWSIKFLPILVE